jgi:hypothetical protein
MISCKSEVITPGQVRCYCYESRSQLIPNECHKSKASSGTCSRFLLNSTSATPRVSLSRRSARRANVRLYSSATLLVIFASCLGAASNNGIVELCVAAIYVARASHLISSTGGLMSKGGLYLDSQGGSYIPSDCRVKISSFEGVLYARGTYIKEGSYMPNYTVAVALVSYHTHFRTRTRPRCNRVRLRRYNYQDPKTQYSTTDASALAIKLRPVLLPRRHSTRTN